MTTVSLVVHKTPVFQLEKAIGCLKNSSIERIYIIDNSPDDSIRKIAEEYDNIEYEHVENRGYGAGHNFAIRKAIEIGSDYHLVMNADVCWEGNIITPLEKYLEENRDCGLIAPKTYYPNGNIQYTCRMLPTPMDLLFKRFLPKEVNKKRMERYLLENFNHDVALNCPYLLGSFLFFRIDALKEVGLFDERFFMYPEDIDITRRIHERWKTIYWPEVNIVHEHQQASQKNLKMFKIHTVNMIKYFNKWGWWKDKKRKEYNKKLQKTIKEISSGKVSN